ncbi:HTTM domain-containing protein [Telluribacter sp. SYSU D00476]|uniref:HTTM domain-containing protein n=1 Tax=Telluribacter sp. SYSU D00476 TaxID=2811430 RepID=UPI001FF61319|nr:HTTM domain-containing protein [Telluribacter sp. SYSU D00476]
MQGYLHKTGSAAPLAVFRILFGLLLLASIVRFWSYGWISELYIKPRYFFPFYGFEFVRPLGEYTYLLFAVCGLSALLVALGLFYRVATVTLFLSFTYIELIDKTTYLNHYYFISLMCFMLMFLPAHVYFSADAFRNPKLRADQVPAWCLDAVKLFVGFLYFFAGLAKVNSDWLLLAQPLRIWLPAHNDLPLVGYLLNYTWVAYLFSWFGCLYDLCIPFLLWNRSTRPWAFAAVVVFHGLTALLFPIGMFPYIMIMTALIFFSADFHQRIINSLGRMLRLRGDQLVPRRIYRMHPALNYGLVGMFLVFFAVQLVLPFRHLFYPGELFWTEQGYRFSWRVMLMEKAGHTEFTVRDRSGKKVIVNNSEFLTPLQEKMMATQPDMILQYAHILRDYYAQQGFDQPQVFADSYVSLNGRLGRPLIDPEVDLANEQETFSPKSWITPFDDEIKGF